MKYFCFFNLFFTSEITHAQDGKGDLQLSDNVVNSFIRYIKGDTSKGKAGRNSLYIFGLQQMVPTQLGGIVHLTDVFHQMELKKEKL